MSALRSLLAQRSIDPRTLSDREVHEELEPLDVGRASRTVTAPQRRAVVVRDRHCRFPGCDRPPGWGDVHHIVHWLDQGRTDLDNLILLCRRHHTLVHEGGSGLSGTARRPVSARGDGSGRIS